MEAGMKRIVFTDVDGTLLNSEYKITPLTLNAIRTLQAKDIPFVIISGRGPTGIYPILKEYGFNCPIVSYSGALILDEDRKVLFSKGLPKPKAKKIIEFVERNNFDMVWCVYSHEEWLVKDKSDERIKREEKIVKLEADEGTVDTAKGEEINKILCICNPEKTVEIEESLKKAFPDCCIVKSAENLVEVMESGITKATAIQTLCSMWGIDIKNAIAFGDNYNDVEMLEAVGHGYLMGNAPDELKERIKKHTRDNNNDGIYCALLEMNLI